MLSHTSLLLILLAPVIAYIVGALVFSLIASVHKSAIFKRPLLSFNYRNGL